MSFSAYLMSAPGEGRVTQMADSDLPDEALLVEVDYSDLNYKDALAVTGRAPILRTYPAVPGIDLVGTVLEDASATFRPGDKALAIGHGMGEDKWGGFSARARISPEGVLPLPEGLSSRRAMAFGTAGLTAALCAIPIVEAYPKGGKPVLVTGATGGVGSVAIMLLSKLGFEVLGSTGRAGEADYLRRLGASEIVPREELERAGKPMERQRWSAVVDTVGGRVLSGGLRSLAEGGVACASGMAGGTEFTTSIYPFILRNIRLLGIHSYFPPAEELTRAWKLLAETVDLAQLDSITSEIGLDELAATSEKMLENQVRGRIVVRVR